MKTVFTNGVFDILHAGHVHFLNTARALGDRLIVAVNTDESVRALKGPTRPINRLFHRIQVLSALRSVDEVHAFRTEEGLKAMIREFRPAILVKAGYEKEKITGADIVTMWGGKVVILDIVPGVSTTEIVERIHAKR
jgi:D-beta-D-heptose 7-phosphate kinase/D-beta-D-heptose 1-phosphate adenosyltransferase